jgi:hypothetical protein
MRKKLLLTPLLAVLLIALAMGIGSPPGTMFHRAQADGERGTLYIDVLPDASNTTSGYGTVDACRDGLAIGDTFDIDTIIAGANDLAAPYFVLYYNKDVLKVTAYDWANWKLGPGGIDVNDPMPDTDGEFSSTHARGARGVNGDGVLLRVTLQAIANGSSDLTLCNTTDCPDLADSSGDDHFYPEALVDDPAGTLRVAVGQSCPEATAPPPTATETVTPMAPQLTPTPGASPALTATATPAPQPAEEDTDGGFPWVAVYAGVGAGVVALAALGLLVRLLRRR